MIAKAIEKIESLVQAAQGEKAVVLNNGRTVYFMNGHEFARDGEERIAPLVLHTLTALVDFIKGSFASWHTPDLRYPPATIVVDDQRRVTLYAPVEEIDYDRPKLAVVEPLDAFKFNFNQFMPAENFIIGLQACFEPTMNRDAVIDAVAGIKSDDSTSLKDDGVCQMATQKRGMQLEKKVELPNPIELTPYRTFAEITQPQSKFVLRATDKRGEPEIGLWEADGGAWKNTAAELIKKWLTDNLSGTDVKVLG